ncbi:unnamed protein product [Rhizophagus irregularis]|nr:unnamed protein product [Rhizophagus irregularis]
MGRGGDYVADDQTADIGKDGSASFPQQNSSGENTSTSFPKDTAVLTTPNHVASSGPPTNKALIEAVNNLFLETYKSYTGKARMTGSGDTKCLVIHFYTAEA